MSKLVAKRASALRPVAPQDGWLAEGLIPARSFILLHAAPKQGKTLLSLSVATAIASGRKALGHYPVNTSKRVLYCAFEDSEDTLASRVLGISNDLGVSIDTLDLHFICNQKLRIDTKEGLDALDQLIKDHGPIGLLVLDNLSKIHQLCESDARAMNSVCDSLHDLKLRHDCSVLLVHHSAKSGGARGSGAILAQYEAAITLRSDRNSFAVMDLSFRAFPGQQDIPISISCEGNRVSVQVEPEPKGVEYGKPLIVRVSESTWLRVS